MTGRASRFCLFLFLGLVLTASLPAAPAAQKTGLENLELKNIREKEKRLLLQLDRLEKEVTVIETGLYGYSRESKKLRKLLAAEKKQIQILKKDQEKAKKFLYRRLNAIYRLRGGGMLQILVNAESLSDLFHKYKYLAAVISYDEKIISSYDVRRITIDEKIALIKGKEERLEQLKLNLRVEKRRLDRTKTETTALLIKVHQRKQSYLALIQAKDESHKKLIKEVIVNPPAQILEKPDQKSTPAQKQITRKKAWPNFVGLKGKLPKPVKGKTSGRFGRSRGKYGTVRNRQGITISARSGDRVRAILSGEVIYADWVLGYGNVIILNHGHRYYTLTAGMTSMRFDVGRWVSGGDVLGIVPSGGKTNKKGIYLEIRYRHKALDPGLWLSAGTSNRVPIKEKPNVQ